MKKFDILKFFSQNENLKLLINELDNKNAGNIYLKNLNGSLTTILAGSIITKLKSTNLFILDDLEDALYFIDDLNNINSDLSVWLFPSSERIRVGDNNVILERIDVLKQLCTKKNTAIITYPKAIKEKIITKSSKNHPKFVPK